jgi:hypothetical protein
MRIWYCYVRTLTIIYEKKTRTFSINNNETSAQLVACTVIESIGIFLKSKEKFQEETKGI